MPAGRCVSVHQPEPPANDAPNGISAPHTLRPPPRPPPRSRLSAAPRLNSCPPADPDARTRARLTRPHDRLIDQIGPRWRSDRERGPLHLPRPTPPAERLRASRRSGGDPPRSPVRRATQPLPQDPGSYFPRAVFFFGFGFLVLPVLLTGASFSGRFGDTDSLPPVLTAPPCPRARIRSETPTRPAGPPADRNRSASPACQSTHPSAPRPETAIVNGCCRRARPAKVTRRCAPLSLSRATAAPWPSQQTTRQAEGSASAGHSTRS